MTEEEKLNEKKLKLKKNEKLLVLGGFIAEIIEEEIYQFYEEESIGSARKYCKPGPGFINVVEFVDQANKGLGGYERVLVSAGIRYVRTRKKNNVLDEDDWEWKLFTNTENENKAKAVIPDLIMSECMEWYLDQVARCAVEKLNGKMPCFWEKWKLTHTTKKLLLKMNPLEERLMKLFVYSGGKDVSEVMKYISDLPEFACDELLIKAAFECLWKNLGIPASCRNEFIEACGKHGFEINKTIIKEA